MTMKKFLFLSLLSVFMLPLSALADNGKICRVEGGSVQAEVTNSPVAKATSNSNIYEYEIVFVLMNSSPNFVNATYVVRDDQNEEYSRARVLVSPQRTSDPIKAVVRRRGANHTFVVDVVEGDCKTD